MESSSNQPHILIAEGAAVPRDRVERICQQHGWTVVHCDDEKRLLAELSVRSFDILITDLSFSTLPGTQLLGEIERSRPGQQVLVVTDSVDLALAADCWRQCSVISAPLDLSVLERLVLRLVAARRMRQANESWPKYPTAERSVVEFCSSELVDIRPALPAVMQLFEAGRIDDAALLRFELAFQEALTNSVEHGNLALKSEWREDVDEHGVDRYSRIKSERLLDSTYADRIVSIITEVTNDMLRITIRDQGQGFKPLSSAKADEVDGVLCHGRGMALIRAGVDEVYYRNGGTEIELVKRLSSIKS